MYYRIVGFNFFHENEKQLSGRIEIWFDFFFIFIKFLIKPKNTIKNINILNNSNVYKRSFCDLNVESPSSTGLLRY